MSSHDAVVITIRGVLIIGLADISAANMHIFTISTSILHQAVLAILHNVEMYSIYLASCNYLIASLHRNCVTIDRIFKN